MLDKTMTGWETFHRIKLRIFSSLLIDQFPQDVSMPNQRPAASVYSGLQERSLNQTNFQQKRNYISFDTTVCEG